MRGEMIWRKLSPLFISDHPRFTDKSTNKRRRTCKSCVVTRFRKQGFASRFCLHRCQSVWMTGRWIHKQKEYANWAWGLNMISEQKKCVKTIPLIGVISLMSGLGSRKRWAIEIHPRPPGKNHKSCDLSDLDRTKGRDLRRGKLIKLPRLSNGVLHVYHRICP